MSQKTLSPGQRDAIQTVFDSEHSEILFHVSKTAKLPTKVSRPIGLTITWLFWIGLPRRLSHLKFIWPVYKCLTVQCGQIVISLAAEVILGRTTFIVCHSDDVILRALQHRGVEFPARKQVPRGGPH